MSRLKISKDLSLPDEAVTQTFAILAKRGVGKTYTASVMTEEMLKAKLQVVVVDPIGVWWGLRTAADGKSAGLPIVVAGGEHGDVPLEATSGELIANLIIDKRMSIVIDLSLLRKGEQKRFMIDFAENLYHSNRTALHLVLDEADEFAPQRPMGDDARMLGAIEDLVRRGRARGIGVTLITQRPAVLNKNVLTQIEVLVAMRLTSPQDRQALNEWVKYHADGDSAAEMITSLPTLPVGTAWLWSPGWLDIFEKVAIRQRETLDSSSTPKVGAKAVTVTKVAPVDLEDLKKQLSATIEKVESEDPKLLRRKIVELERQLKKVEPEIEVHQVEVLPKGFKDRLEDLIGSTQSAFDGLISFRDYCKDFSESTDTESQFRKPQSPPVIKNPPKSLPKVYRGAIIESTPTGPNKFGEVAVKLRAGERKILGVLGERYPLKFTRAQLAGLAKFSVRGGTFGSYFSTLKKNDLLVEDGGEVMITNTGLDYLGVDPKKPALTGQALHDMWRGVMRAGERAMFDYLISIYPTSVLREELAEAVGFEPSGGTFGSYLSTLRRNKLVESDGQGLRAADSLFSS